MNRADILIAKNNKNISLEELREEVINTVTETEKTYWELVFALDNLKVKELSLKRAKDLLETNRVRMKAGTASQLEVLAAEAEVASRKQEVIIAHKMLSDAQDNLKIVTNLIQDPKLWNFDIIPLDKPPLEAKEIDLVESVRTAFKKRPDYQKEKIDLRNKDI
ncbi:MAG: TolC family protein, partial [Firmicutes bacterium]|nr:TolC family protein [Bacillota bacterium]